MVKEKFMTLKLSQKDKAQLRNILANAGIRARGRKKKYVKKYGLLSPLTTSSSSIQGTITNTNKFLKMLGKGKFR